MPPSKKFGCPACSAIIPVSSPHCPGCGKAFEVKRRKLRWRFEFKVPTRKALDDLNALFLVAGDRHRTWTHPNGLYEYHELVTTGEDDDLRRAAAKLFAVPGAKVAPPWLVSKDDFLDRIRAWLKDS